MPESIETTLKLLHGYKFTAEFDVDTIPSIVVDELAPIGEGIGPNPTRLLSVAVGHCLSSSLLYCLQKARIKVKDLQTIIEAHVERNEEGYLRIKSIDAKIQLEVNEEDKSRISNCLKIFENYCTVTQSVRSGIDINVNVLSPQPK